jgi:methionyl-tRNA formyltransferase
MSAAQPLRIAWIGFHLEGVLALEAVLESGIQLETVITLADDALARRSAGVDYPSLLRRFSVPVHAVADINVPESVELLQRIAPDVVFVIGWSQIIRPAALATARIGMIGAHASLLPHNRGSAPINWAIINGERSTGNSLIWLADSVDAGDLIDQTEFPIRPYDTCATLYDRVAESNRDMILRVIPRLMAGERPGRPQLHTDAPVLPRRRPSDGLVNWGDANACVYNFVRALTRPYPGAFSFLDGKRWQVWSCAVIPDSFATSSARAGEVLGPVFSPVEAACGQLVHCGRGDLLLLELEGPDGEVLRGPALADQRWVGRVWQNA